MVGNKPLRRSASERRASLAVSPARAAARGTRAGVSRLASSGKPADKASRVVAMPWMRAIATMLSNSGSK